MERRDWSQTKSQRNNVSGPGLEPATPLLQSDSLPTAVGGPAILGNMSHVRHKPVCSASEASLEILKTIFMYIILSMQRTTKVLIRLLGCAGWSVCAFGVRIWHEKVFLWRGSYVPDDFQGCNIIQLFHVCLGNCQSYSPEVPLIARCAIVHPAIHGTEGQ